MECLPPGATLIDDFVSVGREQELLSFIDEALWLQDLSRRVQHYGWRYDYKARRVTADARLGPLPDWLEPEVDALCGRSLLVLTGSARYEWSHTIPARKSDVIDGRRVGRKRRISLTFRRVISDLT